MTKLAVLLIKFYRKFISPLKPPCCRFYPTCSEYAMTAFLRYGFFRGFWLSLCRIVKCNPFCKGGYDPVPEKTQKMRIKRYPYRD